GALRGWLDRDGRALQDNVSGFARCYPRADSGLFNSHAGWRISIGADNNFLGPGHWNKHWTSSVRCFRPNECDIGELLRQGDRGIGTDWFSYTDPVIRERSMARIQRPSGDKRY